MLGATVVRALSSRPGFEVAETRRRPKGSAIPFDAREGVESFARSVSSLPPFDLWFNAIGYRADRIAAEGASGLVEAIRVNALLPQELARFAEKNRSRLIHMSTDGVFAPTSGEVDEDQETSANDAYGRTKALGEPNSGSTLVIRASIVGIDPAGRRGLLEWLRNQPPGSTVSGYVDSLWNGVTTLRIAELCARLADTDRFDRLREEGAIHHVFGPVRSKYDILATFRDLYRPDITVVPDEGRSPANRTLASRRAGLAEFLTGVPPLEEELRSLEQLWTPSQFE